MIIRLKGSKGCFRYVAKVGMEFKKTEFTYS